MGDIRLNDSNVSIELPSFEKVCPHCGAEYVNIGHPLKPGVIMTRQCKCEYVSHTIVSPDGTVATITVRKPLAKAKE